MTIHHAELVPPASCDLSRGLFFLRIAGVALCGALVLCDCSSSGGGGGAPAAGGASASGGASTVGGATGRAGMTGSSGAGGGSATTAGRGGTESGTAGMGTGGSSGASAGAGGQGGLGGGGGTSGHGGGGTGGLGGGGTGGASAGAGGAADCAGHALSLSANGTTNAAAKARVVIDLMSDLPINNSNRTVELWAYMKNADWNGNDGVFFYGPLPSARDADGFGLDFSPTQNGIGSLDPFTNAVFDNSDQPSGVTAAMSQWVHFAMTWNGTAVQVYVNGILKATKTGSNTQTVLKTGMAPLTIGGYPDENKYFSDYIDEFRIWNVARSAADITSTMKKTLVGNEAGLVGYWQFNESSGTTAADSVTSAGHTAHVGTLMADSAAHDPTFVVPNPPTPVSCP